MEACQTPRQLELATHQARTFWDGRDESTLRSQALGSRQAALVTVKLSHENCDLWCQEDMVLLKCHISQTLPFWWAESLSLWPGVASYTAGSEDFPMSVCRYKPTPLQVVHALHSLGQGISRFELTFLRCKDLELIFKDMNTIADS